jgi:hypothetical protein
MFNGNNVGFKKILTMLVPIMNLENCELKHENA